MKQTAVEWLVENLKVTFPQSQFNDVMIQDLIEQAREIEKQQIIDAYKTAEDKSDFFEYEHRYEREYLTAEPYYNKTFKSE